MSTLTTMKFDGSRTMHEHVIEMTNFSTRLKSLGMEVDESFLVQFILNSLPSEYGPFQMNYYTMKDKWNVHELHSMLVQEETRLKNQGIYSINYVTNQGAGKKRKHTNKGKGHQSSKSLLLRFVRRGLKLTDATFVRRLGISKRIVPDVRLGTERNVNIMLMYVSNHIWLKFLITLGGLILDVQLMFII